MSSQIEILTDQALSGNYPPHGNIESGDCVIGFSFGYIKTNDKIEPGLSNEDLATFIETGFKHKPLILQVEIAKALKEKPHEIFEIKEHRSKGAYLDTSEVMKQALEIMRRKKWETPILVAHPFHVPRVDAVCKKLGIRTIVPKGLEVIRFDPNSEQEWTRNKEVWGKREELAIRESKKRGLI